MKTAKIIASLMLAICIIAVPSVVSKNAAAINASQVSSENKLTAKVEAGAYAAPTKTAAKSATMTAGESYEYISVYTGGDGVKWYLVTVGNARGWVCSSDVSLNGAAQSDKMLTAKSAAGVYASPTKSSAKSASMVSGESYEYTSVYTGGDGVKWYLVVVPGARGWVCQSDVTVRASSSAETTKTTAAQTTKPTAKPTTTATTKPAVSATKSTLTAKSAAGVYAGPTKSAAKAASMTAGQSYEYTSVYTGGDGVKWYLVTVGNARGWVCASDIITEQESTLIARSAEGVYASPTKTAAKITSMSAGASYKYTSDYVGGDKVRWYLVSVGGKRGWVCSTDVITYDESVFTAKSAAAVYASPTKSAASVATMTSGAEYHYSSFYVGGDKVKWYLAEVGGKKGWVCSSDVKAKGEVFSGKAAYLTFDDGPSANTAKILDILDQYGVKATFFVIYRSGYENTYKQIVSRGHTLALHSYSHNYDTIYKSESAFYTDLAKLESYLKSTTGESPKILRFPGGSNNTVSRRGVMPALRSSVKSRGYLYYDWNVDSRDASEYRASESKIISSVRNGLGSKSQAVILMHDAPAKTTTVDALPEIITLLKQKGYTILPITESTPEVHFK